MVRSEALKFKRSTSNYGNPIFQVFRDGIQWFRGHQAKSAAMIELLYLNRGNYLSTDYIAEYSEATPEHVSVLLFGRMKKVNGMGPFHWGLNRLPGGYFGLTIKAETAYLNLLHYLHGRRNIDAIEDQGKVIDLRPIGLRYGNQLADLPHYCLNLIDIVTERSYLNTLVPYPHIIAAYPKLSKSDESHTPGSISSVCYDIYRRLAPISDQFSLKVVKGIGVKTAVCPALMELISESST
jgi:hypothetical protein